MSEDNEYPDAVFDTEGVNAAIRTQGVEWSETNVGRVRADHSSGDVYLHLAQGEGTETDASVSAHFDPAAAREIADSIQNNREGVWETESCTMWLDRGWLRHEGPRRDEAEHRATVSFSNNGDLVEMECVYEGSDEGDTVRTSTSLSDSEVETLVTALEFAADQADEYEPIETASPAGESDSRLGRVLRTAIPTGITLGIAFGVMAVLHSKMEDSGMTINGEPVSFAPTPEGFVVITALIMFTVWAVQYIPGRVGR